MLYKILPETQLHKSAVGLLMSYSSNKSEVTNVTHDEIKVIKVN
jgi:hypothetical protein